MMNLTGKRAVIYGRFSSDMQREESLEAQERACRKFAKDNGIKIVDVYFDRAKTGKSAKRDELQKMLEDSEHGGFDLLLVDKVDRFARNRREASNIRYDLKCKGVLVISIKQLYDPSKPEGVLMESVYDGLAEYYSLNLAQETEKGRKENAYKCKHVGGIPPLGYDVDRETKKLVINPREAQAVRIIFDMYLDGHSYGEIVRALNLNGYRTKLHKFKDKKTEEERVIGGKEFVTNSLHDILKNEKYAGVYTYGISNPADIEGKRSGRRDEGDEGIIRVPGGCPEIISRENFDAVQKRLKSRGHKRKPGSYRAKCEYLLSGKISCGCCNHAYVGNCRPARADHPEYISYRCNNRTKRPRCSGWEIRAELLESIVLGELASVVFNDDMIPELKAGYSRYVAEQNREVFDAIKAVKKQLSEMKSEMDNIVAVVAKTASDALVEALNQKDASKKSLEHRLKELKAQCTVKNISEDEIAQSFKQAREMLKSGKLSTVRALIERYVRQVTINGEYIEIELSLTVNTRVVNYSGVHTNLDKKKTPHIAVLFFPQPLWLAVLGGEGGTRIIVSVF